MATIGELLRQYRLSSGLSQEALAERSTVSVRTISNLEHGTRNRPREKTARLLADGLQLSPDEQHQFLNAAAGNTNSDVQSTKGSGAFRPNRPPIPPNPTVGRHKDITSVGAILTSRAHRIVTLTGPGGVGKTRLAIDAASKTATNFDLGVHFLPLATVTEARDLLDAIATSFGLSTADEASLSGRLSALLGENSNLLLLDNLEQIIEAAPIVQELIVACSTLTILVTSRALLRVSHEIEYPVQPLSVADTGASVDDLAHSSAVRLFLDRAQHVRADEHASHTETDIRTIAEICRRLDGLPLAIELAAARTRTFRPDLLLDRLDQALPVLTDGPRDAHPRLQSMSDAIAWSYDLLSPDQQWLFRSLSVFEGGFTLEAAESIVRPKEQVDSNRLADVSALADQGLIQPAFDQIDHPRFTMFETIREFGLKKLVERGEEDAARHQHLEWLSGVITVPDPDEWWTDWRAEKEKFPDELDNLRAALRWAVHIGNTESAIAIAYSLVPYWGHRGFFREAVESLDALIECNSSIGEDVYVEILHASTSFANHLGDFERCKSQSETALRICRNANRTDRIPAFLLQLAQVIRWSDPNQAILLHSEAISHCRLNNEQVLVAFNLWQRSFTYMISGDVENALIDHEEWAEIFEQHPEFNEERAWFLLHGAWMSILTKDIAEAEEQASEALEIARRFELPDCEAIILWILGEIAREKSKLHLSLDYAQESLSIRNRMALEMWEGFSLAQIAGILLATGDWEQAAMLYGAAESRWNVLGVAESLKSADHWFSRFRPPSEQMERKPFKAAYLSGETLSRGEAIKKAMAVSVSSVPNGKNNTIVSKRELEVLRYVSQGLPNREIADHLFISQRTVDGHVASILRKLDADHRREAIAAAAKRGLL